MASEAEIANRALKKLGAASIIEIGEDTPEGRALDRATFDQVRDELTRRHRWNFAIKRVALPAEVATPVWGPTRSFPKPVDCLRVLEVNGFPEFRIEGDAIVTDQAAPLELRYVARIEDPNLFDVTFAAALAAHLALEICEDVTQSNSKFERMKAWAAETLREAKRLDAIEEPPETLPDEGNWLASREQGGGANSVRFFPVLS